MNQKSRLVYSTDQGRVKKLSTPSAPVVGDGVVRIQRETKGRGGKAVCVVTGIPAENLKDICKLLKSKCATGGAVKDATIEIQGDHREKIKTLLESKDFQVKLAGG